MSRFGIFIFLFLPAVVLAQSYSLRFYGTGTGDIDRVKFRIDGATNLLNVGAGDCTLEFWLKALPHENLGNVSGGGDSWTTGNIIVDRDVFGAGDYGDFGIALGGGCIAFGAHNGSAGTTIVGTTVLTNGQWHHVAVTRTVDGQMAIWIDGTNDASAAGPAGTIAYRNGRSTSWPNDPYLVLGAEKHDYDVSAYPSFHGWLDELRISTNNRYSANFTPPSQEFLPDAVTVGLFHFDEGGGTIVSNAASAAPLTHGLRRVGGAPAGPVYSTDMPPLLPEPWGAGGCILFLLMRKRA